MTKIYTDLTTLGTLIDYSQEAYNAYIAGPMTGYDEFNFPAFWAAAAALRLEFPAWNIVSPAEMDSAFGLHPEHEGMEKVEGADAQTTNEVRSFYMRRDLPIVAACQAIVLLDGWSKSAGVVHELAVAKACYLDIYRFHTDGELQLYKAEDAIPDVTPY